MTVLSNIITPSNVLTTTNTATVSNKTLTAPTVTGMVVSDGTANGVTYLNGSKVLTSGSALVFDGTNLGVGTATPTFASGGGIQNKNATFASFRATGGASTGIDFAQGSDAKGYVFNRDNADIIFGTNSAERIRILSSGEVGIGTSSPDGKLDVAQAMTNGATSAFTSPHLALTATSTTDTTGFVGMTMATSNDSNYGFSYGALRSGGGFGSLVTRFHSNSASGTELLRLDSSGNLGLGVTPSASWNTTFASSTICFKNSGVINGSLTGNGLRIGTNWYYSAGGSDTYLTTATASRFDINGNTFAWQQAASGTAGNSITFTQAMTLDASGQLLVGKTSGGTGTAGVELVPSGGVFATRASNLPLLVNRLTDDGTLVSLRQDSTEEGTISVSGTTVSYNGGHLSRWAQMLTKPELFKGTVMSNLDEMNVYTKDGQPVANEQLNKVKVSDTEGDVNVAGVFVNWSHDEDHNVDEINMAMTGDMIIRIAQGVTVVRGDLLMSAGDGTAKPQGDDIVRSKTVAKVTSNHITCTYADGSYCVPCVLMAC